MKVSEYSLKSKLIILNRLFLEKDSIYIESYDPVNGKPQRVYNAQRELLGRISSDFYWEIEKQLERVN